MRKIRLLVCFPHHSQVEVGFMLSMIDMDRYIMYNGKIDEELEFENVAFRGAGGSMLPKQRDHLITLARDSNATHVLMIDTDMTFPPETAHELLKARKVCIATNAATKTMPSYPTARAFDSSDPKGRTVYSTLQKPKVEPIWRIGTGVMLIDIEALAKIPQPWFRMTYDVEQQAHGGEDWYFCKLLGQYNHEVHIHHHLSMEIGHIGKYEYTLPLTNNHREKLKRD